MIIDMDTIAAISTPLGEGGIAMIRVSGNEAIHIVDTLFKGKNKLSTVDSHTIHYGYFLDMNSEVIDEVLVTVMKAPKTFTREDVVEVNCHGGVMVAKKVLDTILESGARLAEPGEFTKRAFLNGRIDLAQAEAVMDFIRAKTDRAMHIAMKQLEGKLSGLIREIRKQLLEVLAHIEVTIDYPEHDIEEVTHELLLSKAIDVQGKIQFLIEKSDQGKILREGLSTAIIGKPNVGKSSLLNTLLRENKAIVTEIPGTTRDVIEEYINVRGIPLKLVDTAGIRETEDIVEKIGVERSIKALEESDLILLVFNYSDPLTEEDIKLIQLVESFRVIVVINKTDLPQQLDVDAIKSSLKETPVIFTSVKEEIGIEDLENAISELFFAGKIHSDDLTYVSNSRHISILKKAKASIEEAIRSIDDWMPVDMIAIDIKNTWDLLGEIIGDTVNEDLVDQIFADFCVGK